MSIEGTIEVNYADVRVGDVVVFSINGIDIDDTEIVDTVTASFIKSSGERVDAVGFSSGYMIDPNYSPNVLIKERAA